MKKYPYIFIILLFAIFQKVCAQIEIKNSEIKTLKDFPNYKQLIKSNDSLLKPEYNYLNFLEYSFFWYKSDNKWIKGYTISPKDQTKKHPVIIYNRGGNRSFGMVRFPFITNFLSKIASEGYIIIGSQYRGSFGSEGKDEFGGKDVNDILNLIPIVDTIKNADSKKIGLLGWSRGVMMNYLVAKKNIANLKAVISIAGRSNLLNTKRNTMFDVYRELIPYYKKDSIKELKKRSIIFSIDSLPKTANYFLIHGAKDTNVNAFNSLLLTEKMIEKDYKVRLLIFDDEDHNLFSVRKELINYIQNWLKHSFCN